MSLRGIAIYSLRAAIFAAVFSAAYALICRARHKKLRPRRLLGVAYIAALIEITVLRGGVDWATVLSTARPVPQLVPLATTLAQWRDGAWAFAYHTLGNLLWFVPLGWMLRGRRPWQALLAGAALSMGIELAQHLLMTGAADIDDVLLNALGALVGSVIRPARPRESTET